MVLYNYNYIKVYLMLKMFFKILCIFFFLNNVLLNICICSFLQINIYNKLDFFNLNIIQKKMKYEFYMLNGYFFLKEVRGNYKIIFIEVFERLV